MIRAAVVGVGYLGAFHAEKYARSKKSELVCVVDLDKNQAKKVARKGRAAWEQDYRKLPEMGVQCASVASDTSTHFEIAQWLLSHGIDVLVEKPMCTSSRDARTLIETADKHGRILQVGHLERFNPAFQATREVLTRPWFFEVRRIAPFSGRGHDVDVVYDLMIHDIDIVSHLVGRPVAKVEAVGIPVLTSSVDIANARITFEGGAIANVTASRAAFKSERSIRIFQPDVYVSIDFHKKKLKMYTLAGGKDAKGFPKVSIDERKVEERDALQDEIDSFLEAVITRGDPVVSGHDGLRAMLLAERIHDAFRVSLEALEHDPSLQKQVGNIA